MSSLQIPAAQARLLLSPHVADGRHIVLAASLVGDREDSEVWFWRCKDWRTQLAGLLRYVYGVEAARTFEQATRAGRQVEDWQMAVADEVAGLQSTLKMLDGLSEELTEPPRSAPRPFSDATRGTVQADAGDSIGAAGFEAATSRV